MTVVEAQVDDACVGLDNPESHLPARWVHVEEQARNIAMLVGIGALQLTWISALSYFGYVFISS